MSTSHAEITAPRGRNAQRAGARLGSDGRVVRDVVRDVRRGSGRCSGLGSFPALAALLALVACAGAPTAVPVSDRVVLLPQPDGKPSAVAVQAISTGQQLLLDQPYAGAQLQGTVLAAAPSDAAAVQARYGALLAQQPARPRNFVLPFEANSNRLSPAAEPLLDELRSALAALPAGEVIVTGHTDRVGSVEANDRLSLQRAEAVRELLVKAGVDRSTITVVGRGERAPLVPTADEVPEARNRRVEIKVR